MISTTLDYPTAEARADGIARYMDSYHPAGYGTAVSREWEDDGRFYVTIRRATSCD